MCLVRSCLHCVMCLQRAKSSLQSLVPAFPPSRRPTWCHPACEDCSRSFDGGLRGLGRCRVATSPGRSHQQPGDGGPATEHARSWTWSRQSQSPTQSSRSGWCLPTATRRHGDGGRKRHRGAQSHTDCQPAERPASSVAHQLNVRRAPKSAQENTVRTGSGRLRQGATREAAPRLPPESCGGRWSGYQHGPGGLLRAPPKYGPAFPSDHAFGRSPLPRMACQRSAPLGQRAGGRRGERASRLRAWFVSGAGWDSGPVRPGFGSVPVTWENLGKPGTWENRSRMDPGPLIREGATFKSLMPGSWSGGQPWPAALLHHSCTHAQCRAESRCRPVLCVVGGNTC